MVVVVYLLSDGSLLEVGLRSSSLLDSCLEFLDLNFVTSTATNSMLQKVLVTFLSFQNDILFSESKLLSLHGMGCDAWENLVRDFLAISHQRKSDWTLLITPTLVFPGNFAVNFHDSSHQIRCDLVVGSYKGIRCSVVFESLNVKDQFTSHRLTCHKRLIHHGLTWLTHWLLSHGWSKCEFQCRLLIHEGFFFCGTKVVINRCFQHAEICVRIFVFAAPKVFDGPENCYHDEKNKIGDHDSSRHVVWLTSVHVSEFQVQKCLINNCYEFIWTLGKCWVCEQFFFFDHQSFESTC